MATRRAGVAKTANGAHNARRNHRDGEFVVASPIHHETEANKPMTTTPDIPATPQPDEPAAALAAPAKKKPNVWGFWAVFGVVVLCCSGFMLKAFNGSDDDSSSPEVTGVSAELACQDFVKNRLKAPSTAKFSAVSHTGSGSFYTVTGAVDAQNSFGAMLRLNFTCKVTSQGDKWVLTSLTGLN